MFVVRTWVLLTLALLLLLLPTTIHCDSDDEEVDATEIRRRLQATREATMNMQMMLDARPNVRREDVFYIWEDYTPEVRAVRVAQLLELDRRLRTEHKRLKMACRADLLPYDVFPQLTSLHYLTVYSLQKDADLRDLWVPRPPYLTLDLTGCNKVILRPEHHRSRVLRGAQTELVYLPPDPTFYPSRILQ